LLYSPWAVVRCPWSLVRSQWCWFGLVLWDYRLAYRRLGQLTTNNGQLTTDDGQTL